MRIRSVLAALALLMPGSLRLAHAGGTVPIAYDAATDRMVRPKPVVPTPRSPGSFILDPAFGSRILRITGPNTQANALNTPFHGPADAFVPNWNADSTMFWVYGNGGVIPFRFDAALLQASRLPKAGDPSGGLLLDFEGPFSYRKPNIMYGAKADLTVFEYDFASAQKTTIFKAGATVRGASGGASMPSVSDDDSRLCVAFSGTQGTYQYIVVLDRPSGFRTVLDTQNSRLNGHPTVLPLGFGVQTAHIDRSGRYVVITKGAGSTTATPSLVWDVATGLIAEIRNNLGGTETSGFGVSINESGYSGAFYEPMDYVIRSLDPGQVGATEFLIDSAQTHTPHLPIGTGYFSWNNAHAAAKVPIVGTHYRKPQDDSQARRAWDDEIIAVATDGSSRIWRFANHYSIFDGSNYWDAPRGSVSQDGRWYLYTSNWGKDLGTTPNGQARQDMFLVELLPMTVVADDDTPSVPVLPLPGDASGPPPPNLRHRIGPAASHLLPLRTAGLRADPRLGLRRMAHNRPAELGAAGSIVSDPDTAESRPARHGTWIVRRGVHYRIQGFRRRLAAAWNATARGSSWSPGTPGL